MELTDVDAVVSSYLAHDPNYPWHVATAVQELCEQPLVVARERHVMPVAVERAQAYLAQAAGDAI